MKFGEMCKKTWVEFVGIASVFGLFLALKGICEIKMALAIYNVPIGVDTESF